jgi:hypothetical protein
VTFVWRRAGRAAAPFVYLTMPLRAVALIVCLLTATGTAQQRPLPDPTAFLQEARKHLETDDERQRGYMYVETRRDQKLDKNGKPTSETVKVFESYPGLPGEDRWDRVISEDGRPTPPAALEKLDADRRRHAEEYARKAARDPAGERARLDRERARDRRERSENVDDVFRVFDLRMTGRETIDGHDTIVFTMTPRADAKPRTRAGGMMKNFAGRVWISESDHELVRVRVEAIEDVSIGFGLLARLHKGSQLFFERRKVNDEAWLPASARYAISGRIGLLAVMRRGADVTFSNYRKFSVDTSTTIALPKKP